MDYGQVLEFSFAWLKERESLKYVLLYWLATVVNLAIFAGLVLLFFGDIIANLIAGNYIALAALGMNWQAVIARLLFFAVVSIPILIVFWLVFLYIGALMRLFALRKASLPAAPFSFYKVLRLIVLGIVSFLIAFFSWYNKIFLPILIAAIVCTVAAFFFTLSGATVSGAAFLLLAVFIFLVYCIVLIYNGVRLSQCGVIFLSKEIPIMQAINESWGLTNKRFWPVFLAGLLVGIVTAILVGIATLVLAAIMAIPLTFALPFGEANFWVAFNIMGQNIASFIIVPFSLLISSFCGAAIYKNLLADSGQKVKK